MKTLSLIRSKVDFIGILNPSAWDAIHPHTPFVFSNTHVELLVADVVKHVGAALTDKALSRKALELSKEIAQHASSALVGAWEPGDELCPPWRKPVPVHGPFPPVAGPQPEPWQSIASAEQIQLADVLTHLSGLKTNADFWAGSAFSAPWASLQAQRDFAAQLAQEAFDRAMKKRLAALLKQQNACSEARSTFIAALQDYADITSSLDILCKETNIVKIQSDAEGADVVENVLEQTEDPSIGQGAVAGTTRAFNIIALNRSFDAQNAQIALTQGQRSRMINKIKAAGEAKDAACSTAQ